MPNINLAPTDAQQQAINRKRQLAAAMQQMAMQPLQPPSMPGAKISPWEGIAKLVQGLSAGVENRNLDKQQTALSDQVQASKLAQALALSNAATPQPQGLVGAMAQPQEAQIPGENAVPAQPVAPTPISLPVGPGQVQGRNQSVSALARALSSEDPNMAEAGKMLLQNQLTGTTQERAQAAEMARQLGSQQFQQGQLGQEQRFTGVQNNLNRGLEQQKIDLSKEALQQKDTKPFVVQKDASVYDPENGSFAQAPGSPEKFTYKDPIKVTIDGKGPIDVVPRSDGAFVDMNTKAPVQGTIGAYVPPSPAHEQASANSIRDSQQFNLTRLDKDRTPLAATASAIDEAKGMLTQNNPQANALVVPVLIKAILPAGQGSNLRITQSEMNSVGVGTKIQDFEKWVSSWSADPTKYQKLLPEQKLWLNAVMDKISEKAQAKLGVLDSAGEAITNGATPQDHQRAVTDAQKKLSAIDSGRVKSGVTVGDALDKVFGPAPKAK